MLISAFAKATGLNRSTIRFYVQRGLLNPATSENGYQHFSPDDIAAVHFATVSKFVGFSLSQTVDLLRRQREGSISVEERIAGQRKYIGVLDKKIKHLQQVRYIYAKRLEHYESGQAGDDPFLKVYKESQRLGKDQQPNQALKLVEDEHSLPSNTLEFIEDVQKQPHKEKKPDST